ncbi:MAG: hypothetical protein WD989_01080 [Candidatus Paceibacterota bacterium]
MSKDNKLEKIVSLAKRRGFIFPGSEIYGGIGGFYDFGPLGDMTTDELVDRPNQGTVQ